MGDAKFDWVLYSEHSGPFLRLQRLVQGKRSFVLCFLTYTDSAYRNRTERFLKARLGARVVVAIDRSTPVDTANLFGLLSRNLSAGPAQLSGLELWADGISDLLRRLNYRREALAARCARPLFVWVLTKHLSTVATGAADLWAWRSGVFDFSRPPTMAPSVQYRSSIDQETAPEERRRMRLQELERYLDSRSQIRLIDVDLLLEIGDLLVSVGELPRAEAAYLRALEALAHLDDPRRRAITHGRIADLLQSRGDLDEAQRIREQEEIPIYKRLGDVRSLAVTRGQIADILQCRGDLAQALRIRESEEIPVYERLGDERSIAITHGQIADILLSRGEVDATLAIREQRQLPVFERLGDVRSVAIVRGAIADILQARGELDEALRIRREDELPVYDRLGDRRSFAITQGQVADILQHQGDLHQALRIRKEEELPVYRRLGDWRSYAITQGQIADILQSQGDLREALRIRKEEELPVYERLRDKRLRAIALAKIDEYFATMS